MSINFSLVVEAYAVIYRVRLGLCFKAECTVLYLLDTTLEVRARAEEVAGVELYAGLVGIYPHRELIRREYSRKTERLSRVFLEDLRSEYIVVVVAAVHLSDPFAYRVGLVEVEGRSCDVGAHTRWNEILADLGVLVSEECECVTENVSAKAVEIEV